MARQRTERVSQRACLASRARKFSHPQPLLQVWDHSWCLPMLRVHGNIDALPRLYGGNSPGLATSPDRGIYAFKALHTALTDLTTEMGLGLLPEDFAVCARPPDPPLSSPRALSCPTTSQRGLHRGGHERISPSEPQLVWMRSIFATLPLSTAATLEMVSRHHGSTSHGIHLRRSRHISQVDPPGQIQLVRLLLGIVAEDRQLWASKENCKSTIQ